MYCDWPIIKKCCFCLPLRIGVIVFSSVNIIFYAFMIGIASYTIHHGNAPVSILQSPIISFPTELCIVIYCAEIIFNVVLIYGAYRKSMTSIKAYYYFALVTTLTVVVLQMLDIFGQKFNYYVVLDTLTFMFAGLCMQIYLITIVRSLLKKLQTDGPHVYDNQLHQIVTGELKVENNGVYNNLTTPAEIRN